jgi:hypothetical protein
VVEYKIPGFLARKKQLDYAISEVQKNINEYAAQNRELSSKYIGIVLDGQSITFTKLRKDKWRTEPISKVTVETVSRMLEYLRGLARKPLDPEHMVEDFGPKSLLAKSSVLYLYNLLDATNNNRVTVLYQEWKKTFNQVCGYEFVSAKLDVRELYRAYGISSTHVNLTKLLYAIHTYYALVIKFLAAEITAIFASPFLRSFLEEIVNLHLDKLKERLTDLEERGACPKLRYTIFSGNYSKNLVESIILLRLQLCYWHLNSLH